MRHDGHQQRHSDASLYVKPSYTAICVDSVHSRPRAQHHGAAEELATAAGPDSAKTISSRSRDLVTLHCSLNIQGMQGPNAKRTLAIFAHKVGSTLAIVCCRISPAAAQFSRTVMAKILTRTNVPLQYCLKRQTQLGQRVAAGQVCEQ
jgi:hypothetical protein